MFSDRASVVDGLPLLRWSSCRGRGHFAEACSSRLWSVVIGRPNRVMQFHRMKYSKYGKYRVRRTIFTMPFKVAG